MAPDGRLRRHPRGDDRPTALAGRVPVECHLGGVVYDDRFIEVGGLAPPALRSLFSPPGTFGAAPIGLRVAQGKEITGRGDRSCPWTSSAASHRPRPRRSRRRIWRGPAVWRR